jgi:hypothetical protein
MMTQKKLNYSKSFFSRLNYDSATGLWLNDKGESAINDQNFLLAATKKNDVETGEDAKQG